MMIVRPPWSRALSLWRYRPLLARRFWLARTVDEYTAMLDSVSGVHPISRGPRPT